MRLLTLDLEQLRDEIDGILILLEDDNTSEALDELEIQRGTIDTILNKAGRSV
jgi:hypothetical protein